MAGALVDVAITASNGSGFARLVGFVAVLLAGGPQRLHVLLQLVSAVLLLERDLVQLSQLPLQMSEQKLQICDPVDKRFGVSWRGVHGGETWQERSSKIA